MAGDATTIEIRKFIEDLVLDDPDFREVEHNMDVFCAFEAIGDVSLNRIRIHLADLDDVEIRREVDRMDLVLVLHSEKLVVVIELKVDADEERGQLENYRRKADATWST
jgi:hypothetical protein